ncbi:unnamed protein product [Meganyctiphanes norvegica]|uniref:C2H2-type domain-containing protein n=1 Tax=Meganyctiphanes norvegica TaxID=48144 RepID=A0AAV2QG12_MEGNR
MDLGGIVIEVADDTNWEGSVVTTINVNNSNKISNAGNRTLQVQNIGNTNVVQNEVVQESEQYVGQVLEYEVPGVAGAINVQYGIENENPSGNVQYVQNVPYNYEVNNYNVENHMNYSFDNKNEMVQNSNVQYNDFQNIDPNITYSIQTNSTNHLQRIHEVPVKEDTNGQVQYVFSENNNAYPEKESLTNPKKEKNYQCPHCDYRTDVPRSLTIHIRRHTGEKPYLCDKCGDSFTNPSDLLRHKIRHTDQREYLCGQCDSSFKDVAGINKHVKTMHFLGPGEISHYRFKEETSDWGEKILFIKVVKDSKHFVRRFRIVKS